MKLPAIAIANHRFTIVIILLLGLLGVVSLNSMPRSEDPQFKFPAAMVRAVYPGTSALDMEKLIVDPIEEVINELDDIRVLKSDIEDGLAVIQVEFLYGTDPQDKYDDVVAEVTGIRDTLPNNIALLAIDRISPIDVNILQVAITTAEHSYLSLKKLAETLEKQLERVPGVKKATIEALPQQQLHINANLSKMKELGVGLEDLLQAIRRSGTNLPGGHVLAGNLRTIDVVLLCEPVVIFAPLNRLKEQRFTLHRVISSTLKISPILNWLTSFLRIVRGTMANKPYLSVWCSVKAAIFLLSCPGWKT